MPRTALLDLNSFQDHIREELGSIYRLPTIAFEHGAACPANRAGACIDHAHLHLVPTSAQITLNEFGSNHEKIDSIEQLGDTPEGEAYLYYDNGKGACRIMLDRLLPNQFLRRRLAEALQCGEIWDWREHPLHDQVTIFVERWVSHQQRSVVTAQ